LANWRDWQPAQAWHSSAGGWLTPWLHAALSSGLCRSRLHIHAA